jgi:hypothetical protein
VSRFHNTVQTNKTVFGGILTDRNPTHTTDEFLKAQIHIKYCILMEAFSEKIQHVTLNPNPRTMPCSAPRRLFLVL